jgi:transposase
MAPYSMDLRERVLQAFEASGEAEEVAATFGVSRAWVHRLAQRRREAGSIAPRRQRQYRARVLAGQEQRLASLIAAQPDATLAELRDALPTRAAPTTIWRELGRLQLTIKKNRTRGRTTTTGCGSSTTPVAARTAPARHAPVSVSR